MNHGWWEDERSFAESLALIHSEVSEALEDWRNGLPFDKIQYNFSTDLDTLPYVVISHNQVSRRWYVKSPMGTEMEMTEEQFHNLLRIHNVPIKPVGIPVEFADIIISVLNLCARYGIDIEKALTEKMKYNEGRPYRHGGKLA